MLRFQIFYLATEELLLWRLDIDLILFIPLDAADFVDVQLLFILFFSSTLFSKNQFFPLSILIGVAAFFPLSTSTRFEEPVF